MTLPLNAPADPRFLPTSRGLALGLGCAPLGNLYQAVSDEQAHALIDLALADGCRAYAGARRTTATAATAVAAATLAAIAP